ncbi:MAG: hypothetical protein DHS20C05_09750 [Hyphococcus sp.]|nr:MAG: hypothetical protein DHS20C05_09750 [Marinicaulis sp.]
MAISKKDPTEAMRQRASEYEGVDEGTACTQSAFKTGGKAFLFVGEQGGRYKAMFKLDGSKAEAKKLSQKEPDNYQAGSSPWVTARFTAEKPMPKKIWAKWLDESYGLTAKPPAKKKAAGKRRSQRKKL